MPKLPLALVLLAQAAIKYRAFRENGRAETDAMQPLPDAGWPQATLQGIRQGKQEGFASLLALQLKLRALWSGADVGAETSQLWIRAVQSWLSDACIAKVYMQKVPPALYLLAQVALKYVPFICALVDLGQQNECIQAKASACFRTVGCGVR